MMIPFLLAALWAPTAPPAQDAVAHDKAKLQGAWVVLSAQRNGESIRDEELALMSLKFTGDMVLMKVGGAPVEKKYTIDPTKTPHTIDFVYLPNNRVSRGIYRFDGDQLIICFDRAQGARPLTFSSKGGKYRVLLVLNRQEP